nr:uncharacterized protein LOC117276797 [Nicotiana tomentosiformis]
MREVHEEICGNHSGANSLVLKLVRVGYHWPRTEQDAKAFIKKCNKCQCHAQLAHQLIELLHSVLSSWPLMKWGMDIVGLLLPGPEKAESTNKVIIQNLKKRLEFAKGKWPEELPSVLWAYRTTAKSSMGETPFSLVYGAEALIPVEVGEPTLWFSPTNEEANNEALLVKLELLDERRDLAHIRMVAQKQKMKIHYNRRANLHYFRVGDLVLRKVT